MGIFAGLAGAARAGAGRMGLGAGTSNAGHLKAVLSMDPGPFKQGVQSAKNALTGLGQKSKQVGGQLNAGRSAIANYTKSFSRLGRVLNFIRRPLQSLWGAFKRFHAKFYQWGTKLRSAGAQWSLAISAPLGAAARRIIGFAADIELAGIKVIKVIDAPAKHLGILQKQLRLLSATQALPFKSVFGIGQDLARMGIDVRNIAPMTDVIAKLTQATNLTAEFAAPQMARFMAVTGELPENVERVASSIVDLGNKFAVTEHQILAAATRMAGLKLLAGLTAAEITGLAAAMGASGLPMELSTSSMLRIYKELNKQVRKGGTHLELLGALTGMTGEEFRAMYNKNKMTGYKEMIRGIAAYTKGGGDFGRLMEGQNFDNVRTLLTIAQTTGNWKTLYAATEASNKAYEENIALQKEINRLYKAFTPQLQIFWNEFKLIALIVGEHVLPILTKFIDEVRNRLFPVLMDWAAWFASLSDKHKKWLVLLVAGIIAIGPMLLVLSAVLSMLSFVNKGFFKAGFGVLLFVGLVWLGVKALQTVGDWAEWAGKKFNWLGDKISGAAKAIKDKLHKSSKWMLGYGPGQGPPPISINPNAPGIDGTPWGQAIANNKRVGEQATEEITEDNRTFGKKIMDQFWKDLQWLFPGLKGFAGDPVKMKKFFEDYRRLFDNEEEYLSWVQRFKDALKLPEIDNELVDSLLKNIEESEKAIGKFGQTLGEILVENFVQSAATALQNFFSATIKGEFDSFLDVFRGFVNSLIDIWSSFMANLALSNLLQTGPGQSMLRMIGGASDQMQPEHIARTALSAKGGGSGGTGVLADLASMGLSAAGKGIFSNLSMTGPSKPHYQTLAERWFPKGGYFSGYDYGSMYGPYGLDALYAPGMFWDGNFAKGGLATHGLYQLGELGPEMVMNNKATARWGAELAAMNAGREPSGVNVTFNNSIEGGVTSADLSNAIGEMMSLQRKQVLRDLSSVNNPLANAVQRTARRR